MSLSDTLAASPAVPDSAHIIDKIVEDQSLHHRFGEDFYAQPVARFFRQDYSLTSVGVQGVGSTFHQARIPQLGSGRDYWNVEALSHFRMDDQHLVWGNAAFEKGKRENVQWNETSDFDLLYPYVMADKKGGDMDYEKYLFNGGYAGKYDQWLFGATMGYRALNEYRTLDPRPNNVVADLKAEIAVGLDLEHYALALGLKAGKYKQTNELKFFNELGAIKEYHLTGVGHEFVRFSGACNNVFYKGKSWGADLSLVPVRPAGWYALIDYAHFSFDKVLSNLNRLPLNHLQENKISGRTGWQQQHLGHRYGMKVVGTFVNREGYDNLFGDAVSNVYPQIGRVKMYKNRKVSGQLLGYYEQTLNHGWGWGISPYTSFWRFESLHTESTNRLEVSSITGGTVLQGNYSRKKNGWFLSIHTNYRKGLDTSLRIAEGHSCSPDLQELLEHTVNYFSKHEWNTQLALRYHRQLRFKGSGCFVEGKWHHGRYDGGCQGNLFSISTGVTF